MHQKFQMSEPWIHFTKNKIEINKIVKKYSWQKPHSSNKTGTPEFIIQIKKKMKLKKSILVGKVKF